MALVVRARPAYLGLETKVTWPGPAVSIPATPVISAMESPWTEAPRYAASSANFMVVIVAKNGKEGQLGRVLGGRAALKRSCWRVDSSDGAGAGFFLEGEVMTARSWSSSMEVRGT